LKGDADFMDVHQKIFDLIAQEKTRQEEHLELIASENYTSLSILKAQGSILTNKYAEGYPQKRYYGGCEYVDKIEQIAIEHACQLYRADYANVQPHSGSSANAAVYQSLLKPGDKIMGLSLDHGGHLTHGSPVNFSGKIYKAEPFTTNEEGFLDYELIEKRALTVKPQMLVAGFSAYSRVVDWERFRYIADKVDAFFLADMAHLSGLVATDAHPSPLPWADIVTSTTHKTLRGPRGGMILTNRKDMALKMNKAIFPGTQGGPLMHVIAAKALCYAQAQESTFKTYIDQVIANAQHLAQELISKGYEIITGGTDTHLFLLSLRDKAYSGKDLEEYLQLAHITLNKNTIPGDNRSPFVTSGLRIGTAAVTTRGMKEKEMTLLANWIDRLIKALPCPKEASRVAGEIKQLCQLFPVEQ
jgi:glycine hydroxymethyltransferase